MAKVTIYVPDELKADMDAVDGEEPNWSAVAQDAFRLECQRLSLRKRSKGKMDAVVQRLRESQKRVSNDQHNRGFQAGREWAMNTAQLDQLVRLQQYDDEIPSFGGFAMKDGQHLVSLALFSKEMKEDDPVLFDAMADEFWREHSSSERPTDDYVQGFVEGACDVYQQVKDKL